MKKLSLIISILLVNNLFLYSQTVTGKIINSKGEGLGGLYLQLYINSNVFTTKSDTDGTFIFLNVTKVEDKILPEGYSISNNYPNPFNPKTRINISLPKTCKVKIELFNTIGQRVNDIPEKELSDGNNYIDLEFNGLSNGIYFAKINIDDNYTIIKKIVLLYGSRHLSGSVSQSNLHFFKSVLDLKLDSLVVSWSAQERKTFTNLPNLIGSTLDLGTFLIEETIAKTCPGIPYITYEGKTYNTVLIENQCWFKENLDVGTMIQSSQNQANNGIIEKYCYNDDPDYCIAYGGLYQWNEAMKYKTLPDTQGICPDGWHIPTESDFQAITASVNNNGNELISVGQGDGTNTSGFSALFAGYKHNFGPFTNLGTDAMFWSSTEYDNGSADFFWVSFYNNYTSLLNYDKYEGFSVRCQKVVGNTDFAPHKPTLSSPINGAENISNSLTLSWNEVMNASNYTLQVSTDSLFQSYSYNESGLTNTSNQIIGLNFSTTYYWRVSAANIYGTSSYSDTWHFTTPTTSPDAPILSSPSDGFRYIATSPILAWNEVNTAASYTLQVSTDSLFQNYSYNKSGLTNTSEQITGLKNLTKYYWRVSAENIFGTSSFLSVWSFTTTGEVVSCPGTPNVTYAGKTYNTVQIRDQCWLKENLDVGTMIPGIQNQTNNEVTEKYCFDDDINNCNIYGGLYQWAEAVQYQNGNIKGICPGGWHIPSVSEFETLLSTVNSDGSSFLAVGQGNGTNTTGFSALLAGQRYYIAIFSEFNALTLFQTSGSSSDNLYLTSNGSYSLIFLINGGIGGSGISVRCLKN
jgi:uncharacterized protein (TIGR02145 family)